MSFNCIDHGPSGLLEDLLLTGVETVHIERVSPWDWWMGIDTPTGTVHVRVRSAQIVYAIDEREEPEECG